MDGEPCLPGGGGQTYVGLLPAGVLLLDSGLVYSVLQEALPCHWARFVSLTAFGQLQVLTGSAVLDWCSLKVLLLCLETICAMFGIVL